MKQLRYDIPGKKKMRVVIDTDAGCECDDHFAIVHALFSPVMEVRGILSEHYGDREENTMESTYQAVLKTADLAGYPQEQVFRGVGDPLPDEETPLEGEAVDYLIREALAEDEKPLFVLCQGALSNIASAILKEPEICGRMLLVMVAGAGYPRGAYEFNTMNDPCAFNVVMNSRVPCWVIPEEVYGTMQTGMPELMEKVYPYGELGKYLTENTFSALHRMTEIAPDYSADDPYSYAVGFPNASSWSLGDSSAVGLLLSHRPGDYREVTAPNVNQDGTYTIPENGKKIRWYTDINERFILEDFFAKIKYYGRD